MALINRKDDRTGEVFTPRSDAANAYQLCLDVAQCIRDEPKRYDQSIWLVRGLNPKVEGPACGTIACRAGWMTTLTGKNLKGNFEVQLTAYRILGTNPTIDPITTEDLDFDDDIRHLFSGAAVHVQDKDGEEIGPGDPRYVEEGAAGLERFAEKWRTRLEATPI